jgi:hypothetical protein
VASPWSSIDVRCDSPPYQVVQACRQARLQSPEDVRWLGLAAARHPHAGPAPSPSWRLWMTLWGGGRAADLTCPCGQTLAAPGQFEFTFNTGRVATYLLCQCPRCRTIFWEAR